MGRWDNDDNVSEQVYLLFLSLKHLQSAVETHQKILTNLTDLYYSQDREIIKLKKQVAQLIGSDIIWINIDVRFVMNCLT